ncbi:MAG: hypothetical protein U1E15_11085 [Hyphomicrobiales bacterium]
MAGLAVKLLAVMAVALALAACCVKPAKAADGLWTPLFSTAGAVSR